MRNRIVPTVSEQDKAFVRALAIYEDEAILAFNKPSGLPVQSRGNKARCLDELLWTFARSNGKRPRLVHRIDAGTSGLVLAAKTKPSAAAISQAFEARKVEKTYLALVKGALPDAAAGTIEVPLKKVERGANDEPAHAVVSEHGGKAARTDWRILSRADDMALIMAQPITGRMHQIRVHLAHTGMPIIGDIIYGVVGGAAQHLLLHASRLRFPHPNGKDKTLSAALPPHFVEFADVNGLAVPGEFLR